LSALRGIAGKDYRLGYRAGVRDNCRYGDVLLAIGLIMGNKRNRNVKDMTREGEGRAWKLTRRIMTGIPPYHKEKKRGEVQSKDRADVVHNRK
jgi:hypothetical protein